MTHARTGTRTEIIRSGAMLGVFVGLLAMPQALVARADGSMIQFIENFNSFRDDQSVVERDGLVYTGGSMFSGIPQAYDASNLAAGPQGVGPTVMGGARGADVFGGSIYTIDGQGIIQQDGNSLFNYNTGKVNATGLALFGNDIGLYGAVISGSGSNTVLTIIQPDATQTDYNLGANRRGLTPFVHNGIAYFLTTNGGNIIQYELGPLNGGGLTNPTLNIVGDWQFTGTDDPVNDIFVRPLGGTIVEFYAVSGDGVARSAPFQLVPAPGAAALMALALLTTSTRRRPEGTGNTRPRR